MTFVDPADFNETHILYVMYFEVLNTKIKVPNSGNLSFRSYDFFNVTPKNTYSRQTWGLEREPGVVGWGKEAKGM